VSKVFAPNLNLARGPKDKSGTDGLGKTLRFGCTGLNFPAGSRTRFRAQKSETNDKSPETFMETLIIVARDLALSSTNLKNC
jgi:hypothetical protein